MGLGLGLDLTKAKAIQQETLEKNESIIQKAKENSNLNQQINISEGPSLSINIGNLGKVTEVAEVVE